MPVPEDFKVTDKEIAAFKKAWHETPQGEPGDRVRAGLQAAYAATWDDEVKD